MFSVPAGPDSLSDIGKSSSPVSLSSLVCLREKKNKKNPQLEDSSDSGFRSSREGGLDFYDILNSYTGWDRFVDALTTGFSENKTLVENADTFDIF